MVRDDAAIDVVAAGRRVADDQLDRLAGIEGGDVIGGGARAEPRAQTADATAIAMRTPHQTATFCFATASPIWPAALPCAFMVNTSVTLV